ncbi:MAG: ABC transporter ATP-binding protein [Phycisphaerae bacterium]|nr:ABC transporter ATP-binding protein [Phycisphaerae bacterium]
MSTTIEIRNLSKHYKSFGVGTTKAVDDISLTIPKGSLFFLLGPSGCGKTTLLRMIAGFIEPTSGAILFDGRNVSNVPPNKRNTGMVFQSYALWPHMSVEQNVAFGLSVRRVPRVERERRVMEALRAVRMDEYAKRKPNQLSGGQQQRIALARALVVRPDVLLLDEPLSNLDAKLRTEMRHEIKRICHESRLTTVYVTHDQKEALSMADQIAVLDMGVIAQVGTPRDLYNRPKTRFVADFLGETNFIDGEIMEHIGAHVQGPTTGRLRVKTAAGDMFSHTFNGTSSGKVTCSIRPESLRIIEHKATALPGTLTGRVAESIYLGEMAQHMVELPGGVRVRVSQMPATRVTPGAQVALEASPEDVVVLSR